VKGVEQLRLLANLTNTGDETIKVLHDPRSALCNLPTEAFSVVSRSTGLSPTFIGAVAKFVPEDAALMKAWTTLLPHTSVIMEKDCEYSVFKVELTYLIDLVSSIPFVRFPTCRRGDIHL